MEDSQGSQAKEGDKDGPSKVQVNYWNPKYDEGKQKMTTDDFNGDSKEENAKIFVENLDNTKKTYLKNA